MAALILLFFPIPDEPPGTETGQTIDATILRRRRRDRFQAVALVVIATAAIWFVASLVVAARLIRRSKPPFPESPPSIAWGTLAPLRLYPSDGEELGAWFIDAPPNRPAVLLLHGNNANRTAMLPQAELLAKAGYAVLLVTLRAHGDSTGFANDFGYSARRDVVAAVGWLEQKRPERPIVVWGQSLGAAAALYAAEGLGSRVSGYIFECPYRDLRAAVWNRTRAYLLPIIDSLAYLGLVTVAPMVLPDFDAHSPSEAAARIPALVPVLLLAGGSDSRAPPEEARAIGERIPGRSELVVFERAEHLQLAESNPDKYRTTILEFLVRTLPTQKGN